MNRLDTAGEVFPLTYSITVCMYPMCQAYFAFGKLIV